VSPIASCAASNASSHHGPSVIATRATAPTTAWFVLGARASITVVSR
jgi:hypothetical protein